MKNIQQEVFDKVRQYVQDNNLEMGKNFENILDSLTYYSNNFQVIFPIKNMNKKLRVSTYGELSIIIIDGDKTGTKEG